MFSKIIDIKNVEGEAHIKVKLFNFLKFSILKPELRGRREHIHHMFDDYKNNNKDITTFPKPTGGFIDIQMAELSVFKE